MTLTPQEERVLRLRAEGMTIRQVAHILDTSEQTTKNQMSAVFRKLDVDNIVSALRAIGWTDIPGTPIPEYKRCDFTGQCGRREGHRGQHGGFRAVEGQ